MFYLHHHSKHEKVTKGTKQDTSWINIFWLFTSRALHAASRFSFYPYTVTLYARKHCWEFRLAATDTPGHNPDHVPVIRSTTRCPAAQRATRIAVAERDQLTLGLATVQSTHVRCIVDVGSPVKSAVVAGDNVHCTFLGGMTSKENSQLFT